jgi:basic membrane protein A and related proteins
MKKFVGFTLLIAVIAAGAAVAGGQAEEAEGDQLRVVLYVNGTLGDQSFFDSAHRGMQRAIEEFDIVGRTVEGGWDPANWQPDIAQLADGNWDIVIAGTWQLAEYVGQIAPEHPDKKFITYDTAVDFSQGNLDNVYSILYSQNEGSFLAGALAAMLTQESGMERINDEKVIGFVGGQDIPVINDFRVGYEQGARHVDQEVQVLATYVGSFSDPARGKELGLAQIEQGADIVFGVASESGLGVIEAAHQRGHYAIGVDSDQYQLLKETDEEQARAIVSSMMKNVDNSIYRAVRLHLEGELPYGEAEVLGLQENGVGLARNENFDRIVPDSIVSRIDELIEQIESGEIQVESALGQ